jgi:hypothetical protein
LSSIDSFKKEETFGSFGQVPVFAHVLWPTLGPSANLIKLFWLKFSYFFVSLAFHIDATSTVYGHKIGLLKKVGVNKCMPK